MYLKSRKLFLETDENSNDKSEEKYCFDIEGKDYNLANLEQETMECEKCHCRESCEGYQNSVGAMLCGLIRGKIQREELHS